MAGSRTRPSTPRTNRAAPLLVLTPAHDAKKIITTVTTCRRDSATAVLTPHTTPHHTTPHHTPQPSRKRGELRHACNRWVRSVVSSPLPSHHTHATLLLFLFGITPAWACCVRAPRAELARPPLTRKLHGCDRALLCVCLRCLQGTWRLTSRCGCACGTRPQPFNSTPHGGQSDFVWLPARTPHGGASYVR